MNAGAADHDRPGASAPDAGGTPPRDDADDTTAWVNDEDDVLRPVRGPSRLGSELATLISDRDWGSRLRGAAIFGRWEEIVGPELAQRCRPVRLAGGVLVVRAASAAWATQVNYLAHGIVTRVQAVLGEGIIRTVKVTVGPLETGAGHEGAGGDDGAPGADATIRRGGGEGGEQTAPEGPERPSAGKM